MIDNAADIQRARLEAAKLKDCLERMADGLERGDLDYALEQVKKGVTAAHHLYYFVDTAQLIAQHNQARERGETHMGGS